MSHAITVEFPIHKLKCVLTSNTLSKVLTLSER